MAIISNGEYWRLINGEIDYPNKTVFATFELYEHESDRLKEKALQDDVIALKNNITLKLQEEIAKLGKYVHDTYNINVADIEDGETFLREHPDVAAKSEDFNTMQAEGLLIKDSLFRKDIDLANLKYKDIWTNLGLTAEMCTKISYKGNTAMMLQNLNDYSASAVYTEAKNTFVGEVEDC